jgi:hypothetical protein
MTARDPRSDPQPGNQLCGDGLMRCEMSFRDQIAKLSTEQLIEVKRKALETLREYSTDRGMSFPAEVLIVSGTKSRPAHRTGAR